MGSAAAVPKSGMPPETSPLPAAMSPLATLEALQKQKTPARSAEFDNNEVWKYSRTFAYDADAWEARFGSRQVTSDEQLG
eukprot:symbB.v1.2.000574.t1/scaffold3.1/size669525/14